MEPPNRPVRMNIPAMRWLYYVAAGLVFTLGGILFGLSTQTDRFFAWTIKVPLTAAFLGGAYLGSGLGEVSAARKRIWAQSRIAVPAVLLFSALTGVVTYVHRDLFHFASTYPASARAVAWGWTAIYVGFPVASTVILVRQSLVKGTDPAPDDRLPTWFRTALAVQGVAMLSVGLALFAVPRDMAPYWPWPLTELTARAVGAWGIGLGFANLHAVLAGSWSRTRVAMPSLAGVGALTLVAIARFPATVDWRAPAAWILVGVLVSMFFTGAYGVVARPLYGWSGPPGTPQG
jgi:hypothetical protein